ncbi:cytochrome c biogenesis protein ResB [Bacillus sp. FJAT-44742]|uniref:cytochrome c biogenesis protein ResB n=1 Tax=Bacillus sp. FJAT-44742 TaxID=2014005 RepID=UPI000C243FFB|nr:cytochrome c biogenesis protein ResB [Bacillus sp. FJAT-44742]
MSNKVKCDNCSHVNPYGTQLCESCGKPLEEAAENKEVINMRYEGVARRSQTYNKTIVDKVWNFFSSVKVGIWLIVLTLLASILGTIFPQEMYIPPGEDPSIYYRDEYGIAGQVYYELGLHNMYGSWWYMALVAGLGISLLIASIDRVVPLHRALKTQRVTRHEGFLKRQRVYGKNKVSDKEEAFAKAKDILEKKKYKITEENGNLLAEKGRFSRWGPYVNHLGLIIFLIGAMLRFFPGMYVDEHVWVREGETQVIPGTGGQYYLENEEFFVELYDEDDETFGAAIERAGGPVVETFQTNAVLYEREAGGTVGAESDLTEIARQEIRVNEPMNVDNFSLYQTDYKLNEFSMMSFTMENRETGEALGQIDIDLYNPEDSYDLGDGYSVVISDYFPNFFFDDDGIPSTESRIPDNPAFIFQMHGPDVDDEGEYAFVAIQQNMDVFGENQYEMSFAGVETNNVTALTVRKDLTLPYIIVGGIIFMIGLVQGSYWSHRRIWLQYNGSEVMVAGHTNKNYQTLKRDIQSVTDETDIEMPADQTAEKEEKELDEKIESTKE